MIDSSCNFRFYYFHPDSSQVRQLRLSVTNHASLFLPCSGVTKLESKVTQGTKPLLLVLLLLLSDHPELSRHVTKHNYSFCYNFHQCHYGFFGAGQSGFELERARAAVGGLGQFVVARCYGGCSQFSVAQDCVEFGSTALRRQHCV